MKLTCVMMISLAACCFEAAAQYMPRYSIIITELFPDPSGQSKLPNAEFIELRNNFGDSVNLMGWTISDGSSSAQITISSLVPPGAYLILCPNTAVASYSSFGRTIGVSNFPSLNNDKDVITLRSPDNRVIHSVSYERTYYNHDVKSEGGWSMEMIDPLNPCTGPSNWKASVDNAQATPGKENSVHGSNPDLAGPHIIRSFATSDSSFTLIFDEPLDSLSASSSDHYKIKSDGYFVRSANAMPPLFQRVIISLNKPIDPSKRIELGIQSLKDCSGNSIVNAETAILALSSPAASLDLAFNEILFNPPAAGADYIELYNRSDRVIDLQNMVLANPKPGGGFANPVSISTEPLLLFPKELIAITSKRDWVISHFNPVDAERIIELASLPSMPDDKGEIVILDQNEKLIDKLSYSEKWHFELIADREGIALEKTDPSAETQDRHQWVSASSGSGYGTPGYKNSQLRPAETIVGTVSVSPKTFSPDMDGHDDFLVIDYLMSEPNCAGSVTIYDLNGYPVCYLVKSALLGVKGSFRWDGLNEKKQRLPVGVYIVVTEFYSGGGKVTKARNAVVLARKLN